MSDPKRWKLTIIVDPLLTDDCSEQVKLAVAAERKAIATELREIHVGGLAFNANCRECVFIAKLEKENE